MARTLVSIERGTGEPIYQQLRKALENQLASGALNPRLPLPSSRQLASELGVSRNTVNTAYQELLAQGFIDSRPRSGLFINPEMLTCLTEDNPEVTAGQPVDWQRRIRRDPGSGMPEIAKVRDWDRYPYPFVAGQVANDSFPRLAWARALREALEPPHVHYSLRDGIDEDDPLLLDAICREVLPTRGIEVSPDNVMITLGTQQGLDLLARTLLRPGETVGVEDPGYPDAGHIFARAGARLSPLPVDGSGLIPPSDLSGTSLLHLTPSHHSPTNVTLSAGRRNQLLAMAHESDAIIVEDDYDSEFRYRGSPTPAMKALPGSERIIYLGTFSKFLAPGLRLGYLVADPELIAALRAERRYEVRHPAGHMQRAMGLLIDDGQYHRTIRRRRGRLQRKWRVLRDSLAEVLPEPVDPPPGGVSIWVPGPAELDCRELAEHALDQGIVLERGDIYFADPEANRNHFRLGFAAIGEDAIRPGIARLGEVLHELLD